MQMLKNLKTKLTFLLLMALSAANAQTNSFKFMRKITGVDTVWHSMKLPNDLYKHANGDFADLRIFGISGKDTVEVPYILKQGKDKITDSKIDFQQINQSQINDRYFYTFQIKETTIINQIDLDFKQDNFDWHVTLEGSNNNIEWFSILKNYRILGIKNNNTDYKFTKLSFPDSKYKYFRVAINSNLKPDNLNAAISKIDTVSGDAEKINYKSFTLFIDAATKKSLIQIVLKDASPISSIMLNPQSDFDFYRTFKIEYAADSVITEKGTHYNYLPLYEGTLSSLEKSKFSFPNTIASFLRITIENNDNKPLRISGAEILGNSYKIIARFDDLNSKYALFYGNDKATAPNYEIEKFESKIPINITSVSIGNEEKNPAYFIKVEKPLFENKNWLWALMAVIIILLGWFSFKMLKK